MRKEYECILNFICTEALGEKRKQKLDRHMVPTLSPRVLSSVFSLLHTQHTQTHTPISTHTHTYAHTYTCRPQGYTNTVGKTSSVAYGLHVIKTQQKSARVKSSQFQDKPALQFRTVRKRRYQLQLTENLQLQSQSLWIQLPADSCLPHCQSL